MTAVRGWDIYVQDLNRTTVPTPTPAPDLTWIIVGIVLGVLVVIAVVVATVVMLRRRKKFGKRAQAPIQGAAPAPAEIRQPSDSDVTPSVSVSGSGTETTYEKLDHEDSSPTSVYTGIYLTMEDE